MTTSWTARTSRAVRLLATAASLGRPASKENAMRRLDVSVLVVLSACALAGAAQAADMPLRGSQEPFEVREFISPWYVRGDVGYWFSANSSGSTPSFSDVGAVDFGIGYRGAGWRADVTTSYAFQPHANMNPLGVPDIRARINVLAT